jgi:hypothetical protein
MTMLVKNPRIIIYKRERKLEFYSDQMLLRTYRVGLGFNPVPDKKQEGDGATPEGDFYVYVKNNKSAYYLSLGVSYPNAKSERGTARRPIKMQHDTQLEAIQRKSRPQSTYQIGGLIHLYDNGIK